MTKNWDLFIESLDGGLREWSNSVDRKALSELQGSERERALLLLLSRLSIGSPKVARALGVLPDPRVSKALEAHLPVAQGADKVATASALLELGGSSSALNAVAEGLRNPELSVANEALKAALLAGKPIVPELLATGVSHPRESVRIGALKTALYLCGSSTSPLSWDHRDLILGLAKDGPPEPRRAAFASLCGMLGIDAQAYSGPRP